MTQFFPVTVVLAWLFRSLLPWNGVSYLLALTTICVCDIRISDVVIYINILFGCLQTMNAWDVVTNFSNFSTIHIMHLVAYQTPHLFFCCSISDRPPNYYPAWIKLPTSMAVPSVTIIAMDASMQAFFEIGFEILDSMSECYLFLAWYLLLSLLMSCFSHADRILFQCGLTESSFYLWYRYFLM